MDNPNFIDDFKQKFAEKQCEKSHLYQENLVNNHNYMPQDVINSVCSQMKAIQQADCTKNCKNVKEKMKTNSCFLTVNKLPMYRQITEHNQNKFETQCVSDTQLINIIEDAEALIDTNKEIAQEFDTTFTHPDENDAISLRHSEKDRERCIDDVNKDEIEAISLRHSVKDKERQIGDVGEDSADIFTLMENDKDKIYEEKDMKVNNKEKVDLRTDLDKNSDIRKNKIDVDATAKPEENNSLSIKNNSIENTEAISEIDKKNNDQITNLDKHTNYKDLDITQSNFDNKFKEVDTENIIFDEPNWISPNIDKDRPQSPVFNPKIKKKTKTDPPLTYPLESFENFEAIALPLIEKYPDIETTKHVINSQILGRELLLNADNCFEINQNRISPIIPYSDELHVSKSDINTPIDKKHVKNTEIGVKYDISGIKDKEFGVKDDLNKEFDKEKDSNSPTDEILFSSDDEYEYIQTEMNEIQDLPLTCALETSFYDVPNVLEKTMFVGFQTASNKSIQINTDSFDKAKSILNDDNKEFSLTELVEKCENKRSKSDITVQTNLNSSSLKIRSKSEQLNVVDEQNSNDVDLFEDDIEMGDVDTKLNFKNEEIRSKINNSDDSIMKTEIISLIQSNDINKLAEISPDPLKTTNFIGFTTASNKEIKTTRSAFVKCKNIFKDMDLNEKFDETDDDTKEDLKLIGIEKKIAKQSDMETDFDKINDDLLIEEFSNIEMALDKTETKQVIDFGGFKTASNKSIKISEEAKLKSKNIFQDIDSLKDEELIKIDTASKTEEADAKKGFIAFQTASNKKINVSNKALENTKNIFEDIDFNFNTNDKNMKQNSKDGVIGHENENKIKKDVYKTEFDEEFNLPSTSKAKFEGFKTGNNKLINLPHTALVKAKNVFKDIQLDDDANNFGHVKNKNIQNGDLLKEIELTKDNIINNTNVRQIDKYPKFVDAATTLNNANDERLSKETDKDERLLKDTNKMKDNESTAFIGFKTASNKLLVLSEESLAKSKRIFENLESVSPKARKSDSYDKGDKADYPVFQTTDVKEINEENIPKVMSKHNDPYEATNKDEIPVFKGFQTASKKPVSVSKQSLEKGRKLFENIDDNNASNNVSTPVRNKVQNSVANTNQIYKDRFESASSKVLSENREFNASKYDTYAKTNKDDYPMFKGFQTANNKAVKISEDDLKKSKKLFEEIDLKEVKTISEDLFSVPQNKESNASKYDTYATTNKDDYPMFKGFQTANNKAVKISEDALKKSKKLFEEIDLKEVKTVSEDLFSVPKKVESNKTSFAGFKTANNKKVAIDKDALEKSKKIFQTDSEFKIGDPKMGSFKGRSKEILFRGLQMASNKNDEEKTNLNTGKHFGFETASKKQVFVSEKALAESRNVFKDIGSKTGSVDFDKTQMKDRFSFATANSKTVKVSENALKKVRDWYAKNDSLKDTELLNNFEQKFDAEDSKKTPTRKRSSSPILSCPRAKKRKFETPYKPTKETPSKIDKPCETKTESIIKFTENYKKNKIYTLKDLKKYENKEKKIDTYFRNFDLDNLLDFEFYGKRNELSNEKISITELKTIFLDAVNKNIVPNNWLDIQIKLILWKLISYEVKFSIFVCTIQNTIDQLKYRYDKELYNAERPILRKIYEKDDISSRTMCLCVAGIYVNRVNVSIITTKDNIELLLTDGWYFIIATIDKMLSKLIYEKKIVVGCKIVTRGAELVNCEQGIAPWEDTSKIRLKLSGNSTRLAPSHTKLGCNRDSIISSLSNVCIDGGTVSVLRLCVAIVYPMLYLDKIGDGNTVTRSERLEHLYQMEYEAKREAMIEKIHEQVQNEFEQESEESQNTPDVGAKRKSLDSGSQIAKMMRKSRDPMEFRAQLTCSQQQLLQEHTNKHTDRFLCKLQDKIRESLNSRNVVTLLRARVVSVGKKGVCSGMLSIWKPSDAILDLMKEGAWVEIMNVVPTAIRNSEIQLSAGRQSLFRPTNIKEEKFTPEVMSQLNKYKRKCYHIQELSQYTPNKSLTEIDTVGIVFLIEPENTVFDSKKDNFQNVYLADVDKNIVCVNFWGGIKKFGYQNVIETAQVISMANLQRRAGNTRKNIPQFRVTELTSITKTPKLPQSRQLIADLQSKITNFDMAKFCEDCVAIKNNYVALKCFNVENESPIFNKSDFNLSKNKRFMVTPVRQVNDEFNLTGLDFESTFKQTEPQELSPNTLLRKKRVYEKIDKLKKYGEPPPLTPINIINKSKNAANSYKSPLILNLETDSKSDTSIKLPEESGKILNKNDSIPKERDKNLNENDTSVAKLPEICGKNKNSSPIISLNRTYVKRSNVNPVKLNFSNVASCENDDAFAEEFDGSPPLSLD